MLCNAAATLTRFFNAAGGPTFVAARAGAQVDTSAWDSALLLVHWGMSTPCRRLRLTCRDLSESGGQQTHDTAEHDRSSAAGAVREPAADRAADHTGSGDEHRLECEQSALHLASRANLHERGRRSHVENARHADEERRGNSRADPAGGR